MSSTRKAAVPFAMVTILLDVMGFGLIIPVVPLLVGEFTSSPEAQAMWYGLLTASFAILQFFCAPFLGALSDQFGRRPILLIGIFGLGFNFLLTAMATSLAMLFIARMVSGAMSANLAVVNAYIADVTPPEDRARRFGMIGAAFGIGFIIGPMLGGLLGHYGARLPFYTAAGLSTINWIYGLLVLPESLPRERRTRFSIAKANPFSSLKTLVELKGVGLLIVVFALVAMAQFILHSSWVLFTGFRFNWGPREVGISLFGVGLMGALMQGVLLGRLLKRFGAKRLCLMALTSGIFGYAFYGLVTQPWMLFSVIVGNGLLVCATPALQSMISQAADARHQGATMGALSSLNSVMMVLATLSGTNIFALVTHLPRNDWRVGAPFFLSSALVFIALILALRHFAKAPVKIHTTILSSAMIETETPEISMPISH